MSPPAPYDTCDAPHRLDAALSDPPAFPFTEVLSELYGSHIEVLRAEGRIIVLGAEEHVHHPDHDHSHQWFSFETIHSVLTYLSGSLLAGLILGLVAGVIGSMIQARDLAFAVHGSSELSFAGGAAALLLFGTGSYATIVGVGSIVGSVIAAMLFGVLGARARDGIRRSASSCRSVSASASGCCSSTSIRAGHPTSSDCWSDRSSPSTAPGSSYWQASRRRSPGRRLIRRRPGNLLP